MRCKQNRTLTGCRTFIADKVRRSAAAAVAADVIMIDTSRTGSGMLLQVHIVRIGSAVHAAAAVSVSIRIDLVMIDDR